ncbi:MAG: trypsin-like peptidase domain-containing protein [Saprospiraceae bacterium]|nr:trypsin-like peptidase domain-containing protein [Saprospiraceae bacterium]MCB9318708.1 trypsin-like peptidase domain-containing protein [Lewinellaceae bacterium]
MKNTLQLILASLLGALIGVVVYSNFIAKPQQVVVKEVAQPTTNQVGINDILLSGTVQRNYRASTPNDFTAAANYALPAVVSIKAIQQTNDRWGSLSRSSGSGVIVSSDGYIVTNNHVIENAKEINITLNDNRQYDARVIGTDPTTDLALVKVTENELPFLTFGNSDSLQIGEWVMAVGNPLGLQSTVTAGIVSAKGRDLNLISDQYRIEAFIQTDAAVNPGNSGGALINTNGELIGINTAIVTLSGKYEGYSFAIPGILAQKVISDLREYGSVQRGLLGVQIRNVDMGLAQDLNFRRVTDLAENLGLENAEGVFVYGVNPKSGAEEAGLVSGDVIVAVNGIKTPTISVLQDQIGRMRPGDLVEVEYVHDKKKVKSKILLKNMNARVVNNTLVESSIFDEMGITVKDLSDSEKKRLGKEGIRVTEIEAGSPISRANMQKEYVITGVNGVKVSNADELKSALQNAEGLVSIDGFYEFAKGEYTYQIWKN